jgi:DEAD/DEAH box helicase domain-containing protein
VAGHLLKVNGFQVCASCGKVRDPRDPGKNQSKRMDHAGWCKFRDARVPEKTRTLHLYREVTSEAIRVLLPVAAVDIDEIRASFQAALQLGLRRWFQGNPGHLQVKTLREPAPGVVKAWRTYVVIYDAVPGGTGYLAEMWKAGTFMSVLQKALDALLACSCRLHPERDGCYRCLYAYQTQYDLPDISRRRAIRLLTEILEHQSDLREVATLSQVALESRVESELEQRFVEALRQRSERDNTMVMGETLRDGKLCWQLTIDDKVWSVEPQVDLGPGDHVAYTCRPDFLLHCVQGGEAALPVAVFCDGFEYHAQPHQETGRIADDVQKRQALIASGRFLVWTLTWDDIEAALGGQGVVPSPFGSVDANYLKKLLEHRPGLSHEVISHGPLEQLIDYLRSPAIGAWRKLTECVAFATFKQNRSLSVSCLQGFRDRLKTGPVRFTLDPVETEPGSLFYSWYREDPWCTLLLDISKDAVLTLSLGDVQASLRFFDEAPGRSDDRFKTSWQTGLAAWNLLQFLANLEVIASEGLAQVPSEAEAPQRMYTETVDAALREALDLAHPSCHEFLRQWRGRLPEIGFDVKGPTGRVVATLELAWPDARLGIVLPGQSIEIAGWTLLHIPLSVTEVEDALGSKETPCPT